MVKLSNNDKLIGFKFVLPLFYPFDPPMVFVDEPEDELVVDMLDYLDPGNRIMF